MLNKIYQELVTIRKELDAIRKALCIDSDAEKCARLSKKSEYTAHEAINNAKVSKTYG